MAPFDLPYDEQVTVSHWHVEEEAYGIIPEVVMPLYCHPAFELEIVTEQGQRDDTRPEPVSASATGKQNSVPIRFLGSGTGGLVAC